ncbi:MAG: energy transducer TonB, partial [Bacteroidetes bacterium]
YPPQAKNNGIQGRIFINFIVEPDGIVSDVKILKGIGGGCDKEALRVVKNMPRWEPGVQKGKPVRVSYNLPIKFTLKGK